MNEGLDRHVDLAVIERYFADGVDGVLTIDGDPSARLVVAVGKSELALRVPATDAAPDVSAFANLSIDFIDDEGRSWHQMSVRIEDNLSEVYATLRSIIDRMQLAKIPFSVAVDEVLDSLAEILARRRGLSEDQQLGLAGELLTFVALAADSGLETALEAWMGPLGEEHDFVLPDGDLEVKVTLGERRQHWISSVTQLVPTPNRSLYLVSVQLTLAGAGAGWSLPALVDLARDLNGTRTSDVDTRLLRMGYRAIDTDLYYERWTLRSTPQFFLVDSEFPVISEELISQSVPSSNRIIDVRYRIDLTGYPFNEPLFSFDDLGRKPA